MRVVLLNSGGKDSLAAAMVLHASGHEMHSLFVDFGVPNSGPAGVVAAKVAAKFCVSHEVMSVRGIVRVYHEAHGITAVPHQTVLLHVLAGAYALPRALEAIASGERRPRIDLDDPGTFTEDMGSAFRLGRFCAAPVVLSPVLEWTSASVFGKIRAEPLWRETITCNEWPPCGVCGRCKMRAAWLAFDGGAVPLGGSAGGSGGAR